MSIVPGSEAIVPKAVTGRISTQGHQRPALIPKELEVIAWPRWTYSASIDHGQPQLNGRLCSGIYHLANRDFELLERNSAPQVGI